MEKTTGRKMAFYCSIVVTVGGLYFVLCPLWRFFDAVILPSLQTASSEQLYAVRYLFMQGAFGLMCLMVGCLGWKVAGPEKKRDKEHDAGLLKAENDRLHKKVAELEKAAQEDAESEEIKALYLECGQLEMRLEESESAREGLSSELEIKLLELRKLRQDLEDLKAIHGEGSKLRTMWRYVLDLEAQGKPDDVIWGSLKGDGFSGITADALLFDGKEATFSAVKKYGEREREAGRRKSL